MPKKTTTRGEVQWARVREWMEAGRCRACGGKRGKTGTKQHCRPCADAHQAYLRCRYHAMRTNVCPPTEG